MPTVNFQLSIFNCQFPKGLAAPAEEAHDGDDDVEGVEAALEGDFLEKIEIAGDGINGDP